MKNSMSFLKIFASVFLILMGVSYTANAQDSWLSHYFTGPNGWNNTQHVRTTGDVNGDGKADLVGFGGGAVFVSFSNGTSFGQQVEVLKNFTINAGGWEVSKHPRMMGDVNGDGKDDIIGYGGNSVFVSLSTGVGFKEPKPYLDHYFLGANGWNTTQHVRTVGDINGDGKTDLVGFGNAGVYVSFSTGTSFSKPELLLKNFAIGAGGWEVSKHTRLVADVNGDGKDDIIGYGGNSVFVSLSTGTGFTEAKPYLDHYFLAANGWSNDRHVRTAADINGDGKADLVGFGEKGVYVAMSLDNGSFREPVKLVDNFAQNAGGWRVDQHVRTMADVNGDGRSDIVGFGGNAIFVETQLRQAKKQFMREKRGE
jgi:hypothetical protein